MDTKKQKAKNGLKINDVPFEELTSAFLEVPPREGKKRRGKPKAGKPKK